MSEPTKPIVDDSILSEVEIAAAEKVAREEVAAELKAKAKTDLIEKLKKKERARRSPLDALREITLDLAPHQETIVIDGTIYFHGGTYTVPTKVYEVMAEVQSRGWDHEESLSKSENVGRRVRRPHLSNDNINTPVHQLLRA